MSKSVGNVMYVDELLSYFKRCHSLLCLHEIPYAQMEI